MGTKGFRRSCGLHDRVSSPIHILYFVDTRGSRRNQMWVRPLFFNFDLCAEMFAKGLRRRLLYFYFHRNKYRPCQCVYARYSSRLRGRSLAVECIRDFMSIPRRIAWLNPFMEARANYQYEMDWGLATLLRDGLVLIIPFWCCSFPHNKKLNQINIHLMKD